MIMRKIFRICFRTLLILSLIAFMFGLVYSIWSLKNDHFAGNLVGSAIVIAIISAFGLGLSYYDYNL